VKRALRTPKNTEAVVGDASRPKAGRRKATEDALHSAISIPLFARNLSPYEFPASVRLEGLFRKRGIRKFGQLEGATVDELRSMGNCGNRTITELFDLLERIRDGEFSIPANPLSSESLAALVRRLDGAIAQLGSREREILLLRLGAGKGNELWTLEEAGRKFGLTRERVRQIMELILPILRRSGGPGLAIQLKEIAAVCNQAVCPLTSELFAEWLDGARKNFRFAISVYVRLLGELNPEIPAWPLAQEYRTDPRPGRQEAAMKVLRKFLRQGKSFVSLREAFKQVTSDRRLGRLTVVEFLAALKYARSIAVDFPTPRQPQVRLRWLSSGTAANVILQASDRALTLDELLARIGREFGQQSKTWSAASLRRTLTKSFYWLGPSAFGLRKHIRFTDAQVAKVGSDVEAFLFAQGRALSTARILASGRFSWSSKTNPYELAEILREDRRFVEGRRLVFSTASRRAN
jgi:hypothetical protein